MKSALHNSARAAALAMALVGASAHAFPPPRVDVLWAQSNPWIAFTVAGSSTTPQTVRIDLTGLAASCTDPVSARGLGTIAGCSASSIDTVVHAFSAATGREVTFPGSLSAMYCDAPSCSATLDLLPGHYALMIHGGLNAPGVVSGSLAISVGGVPINSTAFQFAGNVLVSLAGTPPSGGRFDIATVLMPDGTDLDLNGDRTITPGGPGNAANDMLGADGTEAWLLDSSLHFIRADLQQTGVGAAAFIADAGNTFLASGAIPKFALVRPWQAPPFPVRVESGPLLADGQKSPFVGTGRMRVIFNDHYESDSDTDGLSDAVEGAFNLCDGVVTSVRYNTPQGTLTLPCVTAAFLRANPSMGSADPRDTDGDGISDAAEVIGSDVAMGVQRSPDGTCPTAPVPVALQDADETFPLWGFDPHRSDELIDVQQARGQSACPSPTTGCRSDEALAPTDLSCTSASRGCLRQLDATEYQLWVWHESYAHLDHVRTGLPTGVHLHFDARFMAVNTNAHGSVPDFLLHDESGNVVGEPGDVIYLTPGVPNSPGSKCSCNGIDQCPSQRHGGYAHLAVLGEPGAGGHTGDCTGQTYCGEDVAAGQACAHEHGHSLGLDHGGPVACALPGGGVNPYAAGGDFQEAQKLNYPSMMGYLYTYSTVDPGGIPRVTFSNGSLASAPLPVPNALIPELLEYPEYHTFNGLPECNANQYESFEVGPSECGSPTDPCCVDVDMNYDHQFDDTIRLPIEAGSGGVYERSGYEISGTAARDWWCQTTGTEQPDETCCNQPLDINGHCPAGAGTDEALVDHTMMPLGQPTAFLANNRIYTIFLDDVISADDSFPGDAPPRRCPSTDTSGCLFQSVIPGGTQVGKFRYAIIDHFDPSLDTSPTCQHGCAVEINPHGPREVLVDGNRVANIVGSTLTGSATLEGTVNGEVVYFAWTTRGSFTSPSQWTPGYQCPRDGSDCGLQWNGLHLAFAQSVSLETAGFTSVVNLPSFGSGHVDGIALAAWNPGTSRGTPDRLFLVARDATAGHQLYWISCGGDGTCDSAWNPLVGPGGMSMSSSTDVALAVENGPIRNGPTPAAWLMYGTPDAFGDSNLRLLRIDSANLGSSTSLGVQWTDPGLLQQGARPLPAPNDSEVAIAFTGTSALGGLPENRMIVSYEFHAEGTPDAVTYVTTRAPLVPPTTLCGTGATARCIDLQSDPANCGGCGHSCGVGEICVSGACIPGCGVLTRCGQNVTPTCTNTQTDPNNCGGCGLACGAGQFCNSGTCTPLCFSPSVVCGSGTASYCANLNDDIANCGACGNACESGQACQRGTCVPFCGSRTTCGSGSSAFCADIENDSANCGACGNVCPAGQVCSWGRCGSSCTGTVSSTVTVIARDQGAWDTSRFEFRNTSGGANLSADAPGAVAALFFDPRPNVVQSSLGSIGPAAILNQQMRSIRVKSDYGIFHVMLEALAGGMPPDRHFDYDDQQSLDFMLCPTIPQGSAGVPGPDLPTSDLGLLRCQSAAWSGGDAGFIVNRLERFALCNTPGCLQPSPEVIDSIANLISNPALMHLTPSLPATIIRYLPPIASDAPICWNENLSAAYASGVQLFK